MGLFDRWMVSSLQATEQAKERGPGDNFWYNPVGLLTNSGYRVDSETAKRISAWFRGRDLLATSLAMLPMSVYQRLPNDQGAERAGDHPLYDVLHDAPNGWQDSFGWRRQMMYHLIDHGNAYCRIVAGPRGFADQLWPLDPTAMRPEQVASGNVVYRYRNTDGTETRYTQADIFHLRSGADDGVVGVGILQAARESLGKIRATDDYATRVFSQGVLHGGVIKVPGLLDDAASKRMADSFVTAASKWHMPRVLEQGAEYVESKMTPEDAQMLLSQQHNVDDIARWLGVPRMMLENSDPSFGNAEQFNQNFVTFSLGPWLSLFEFACNRQLILNPRRFFVEFTRDALVRGAIAERWNAYQVAVSTGTFTRNEVRRKENMRALPGLDTPLDPAHLTGKQPAPQAGRDEDDDLQAQDVMVGVAARLLRKEIKAVTALAVKHAGDGDAFAVAVTDFYAAHVGLVAESLLMAVGEAQRYCAGQCGQVLSDAGVRACEAWAERSYAVGLASWAQETEQVA